MNRRRWIFKTALALLAAALGAGLAPPVLAETTKEINKEITKETYKAANAKTLAALSRPGAIILFRHALAPGGGDPPGFQLSDCASQRNLSDEGRKQAQRMGQWLREHKVPVQAVWHSAWCRTRDTATLAFPSMASSGLLAPVLREEPAFNSFFSNNSVQEAQTAAARALLLAWRGPGVLVVVSHQVNITTLSDIFPQSGEGIVMLAERGRLVAQGRLMIE